MCLAGRICCFFYVTSLTLFFIRLCDVAHVYFFGGFFTGGLIFIFSTTMSAFVSSLFYIPCILLPACLCCALLSLCNCSSLPDRFFPCRCRFYIGVYPHWDRLFLCCIRLSFCLSLSPGFLFLFPLSLCSVRSLLLSTSSVQLLRRFLYLFFSDGPFLL